MRESRILRDPDTGNAYVRIRGTLPRQEIAEPATYELLRMAAVMHSPIFVDKPENAELFEELLANTPYINDLGPKLVSTFGVEASWRLALGVKRFAEKTLESDRYDRVSKSAIKWSNQALNRITDEGWKSTNTS